MRYHGGPPMKRSLPNEWGQANGGRESLFVYPHSFAIAALRSLRRAIHFVGDEPLWPASGPKKFSAGLKARHVIAWGEAPCLLPKKIYGAL